MDHDEQIDDAAQNDMQSVDESDANPPALPDSLQFILDNANNDPTNPLFVQETFVPGDNGPPLQTISRYISVESRLRRSGIHPITKLNVRTCACSEPSECRAIMWRWAALDEKSMFPYLRLPGYPKNTTTATSAHIIQFRETVSHHLYGYGAGNNLVTRMHEHKGQDWVAMHHFPPNVRPYVRGDEHQMKQFKWRLPLEIGKEYGLTQKDLCKVPDADGTVGKTYMCAPTATFAQSYAEIEEAEQMHGIRHAAANPAAAAASSSAKANSSRASKSSKSRRKSTQERELDRITRDVEANPRAAALQIFDMKAEIEVLKQRLADATKSQEY